MFEGNYISEKIFFDSKKQKELFDIVSVVFCEELKTSNCFILPVVGQRAGATMKKRGFEKANKATFLAAPEYFVLGYNEKNVDAISLIGYPADEKFSPSPKADYIFTPKQESVMLTHEQQKVLAEIFVQVFKEHNKGGKVYLSSVGLWAGKKITEAGLGRVSIELFKGAGDYFAYTQDSKGSYLIYLREDCDVFMPIKSSTPITGKKLLIEKKSKQKEKKQFEDVLFGQLKKNYKTNDISIRNVLTFLRQNKIVLPENISSFDVLIDMLSQKYGSVIRDNGEGTPKEQYIILRKTLPIPQNIRERVELIVAEFFLNQDLIPNQDIGIVLRNNGIDFKEYNFADLTAFIREFPQIFTIVAQPTENNRFRIFVRILLSFKEKYAQMKFERDNKEQILQSQFEKVICEMFAKGKYESIIEKSVLREAIKFSNGEMWNCIIKSYYIINGTPIDEICELTEWEKISFDFEYLCANITDEFLSKFDFSKEKINSIKQYVMDYSHKKINYSILGQRIQALCGKDSYLADAIFNLGLVAHITEDKAFCFRLLILYYAQKSEENMRGLWTKHANDYINSSSMIMIVGTWFTEEKFNLIIEMTERYNEINTASEVIQLYYIYASIILGNVTEVWPNLSIIESKRSVELVSTFLEHTKSNNLTDLYIKMVYNCANAPNKYVSVSSLSNLLLSHSDFLNRQYSYLLEKVAKKERESLIVLRHLISLGAISPDISWEMINSGIKNEYIIKIEESLPENKEPILYDAIKYFPDEPIFIEELISVIKRNGSSDSENLEGFIDNLIDSRNYEQVIMLYEHDLTLEIHDKIWFLRKLSYCYQQLQEPKKSLDTEMLIISSMLSEGKDINECLTQLIDILYEDFISRTIISLDEVSATKLSQLYNHYKCEAKNAHKYWIAMMGLSLCSKNVSMLSLLYCLSDENANEKEFLDICEDEIQESASGYAYRIGDLQKTFEYLVTQEKPEAFFMILGRAANVIRTVQDETIYNKLRDSSVDKVDPNNVIKLIISEYNRERSWKLLSQFSIKMKKYTVNFIANNVWLFKFKDTTYPLTNCTRALERTVDNSLPNNFLWCSLTVWKTDFGMSICDYQKAFIEHIIKCKSFQDADYEIVEAYYNMLLSQKRPSQNEFLLAIEIAKQSKSFDIFYDLFIKEEGAYKSLVKEDINSFVRFCSAFVYGADDESYIVASPLIKDLRNQISSPNINRNDRSALMWLDDLLVIRGEFTADDYFVKASMAILSSYPDAPSNEVVSKWITPDSSKRLPNYVLIRNWINTFGNIHNVSMANSAIRNYLSRNGLPEDSEERTNLFKIRLFLAEKYIVFFNRSYHNTNDDYLWRCKTYYVLRKLVKIETPMPVDFKDKMYKDLEHVKKFDAYLNFEAGVDRFFNSVENEYMREMFLYCGVTNFWDIFFEECLLECDELALYINEIENYLSVIDCRPIRRRLLQMYVYSSAAQFMYENENIDVGSVSNIKGVRCYYNKICNGDIDVVKYCTNLTRLIDILQPSLRVIIKKLEEFDSDDNRLKLIQGGIFALTNKDLKIFRAKLNSVDDELLETIVLPIVIAIQSGKDLSEMLLQMVLSGEDDAVRLLNNKTLCSIIGNYETQLFMSVLSVKSGDFEQASEYLSKAGSHGITYGILYDRLQDAINNKEDINSDEDLGVSLQIHDKLPAFSFMKVSDPYGASLHQLVSDFYSDNMYDAKGKCLVASKILSLIEDGATYSDLQKFLFDWGFVEIESTFDIDKKSNILFEMLEELDKLSDIKAFKERFVINFLYLLQEFDFTILLKNFKRIFYCYRILYSKFLPYENCDCYAQALILLRDLIKLGKENVDPNAAMTEIEDIKSSIIDLHIKYPQNRFANKCINYVDRFIQQIFERGVFEVRILNINKQFNGVIYYQIRNIGFEIIPDIVLTFAIEGLPRTVKQVRISSIIPVGLRPNQVYAGEYIPGEDFNKDIEICCSITIEYTSLGNEGREVYKNYIAVDPETDGKLVVVSSSDYVYQKDGSAGYIEEPIKKPSDFVGRKGELNRIMGKILRGQNVLLFGTNGTGKSSILHNIQYVCLPAVYSDETQQLGKYYAAKLEFDTDCTERIFFESIVNAVSGATLFKAFVKKNGTEETKDILALAAEEWTSNSEKLFDANGLCINTSVVRQYFVTLNEALVLSNLDLYILIDQFERVISSRNIVSKHMLFLRDLTSQKIRFIMAGSNYLLEEVSVDKIKNQQDNSWSDIFSRGFEKVKVGNMAQEDFELLITQKNALNNGEMQYTAEALAYLWQFTKGHAFYSCLLGNRTLDIMSSRRVKRNMIYPSDIFIAIYQPGKYLPEEKSNKEKETAIRDQIFKDINDNTPIKYVGKTLAKMQSSGEIKVSYQKLRDYIEEHRPDILEDFDNALSVLVARDFITYDEIDIQQEANLYRHIENLRVAREYFFTSDLYLEHFATVYVPELLDKDREALESKNQSIDELVSDLRTRKFSAEDIGKVRDALKEFVHDGPTTVINTDTVVGTNTGAINSHRIGTQNNMQINVQSITNAFNQILSGATGTQLLASIADLPRLDRYYKENTLSELVSRVVDGDFNAEAELAKGSEQMISDYQTALIQQEGDYEFCVWQILGLQKDEYDYLSEKLSPNFIMDLFFAAKLESIFAIIDKDDSIQADKKDFSPVSIMYCKIVEKMLKRYHIDIYQKRLFNETTWQKYQGAWVTFGDLNNPKIKKELKNKITLGAFLCPIYPTHLHDKSFDALARTESKRNMWMEHSAMLNEITKIRNKSAHGVEGSIVDGSLLKKLKSILFESEGLLKIVILSE